jgi:hypothetical protein
MGWKLAFPELAGSATSGGMSSPPIMPEQLATLPSEIRVVAEAMIQHDERRISQLKAELAGFRKTLQDWSMS